MRNKCHNADEILLRLQSGIFFLHFYRFSFFFENADSINLHNPFFFVCRNAKVTYPHVQLSLRGLRRKHLLLLYLPPVRLLPLLHRLMLATRPPQAHLLLVRTTAAPYARGLATGLSFTETVLTLSTVILAPRDYRTNRTRGVVQNAPSVDALSKRPSNSSSVNRKPYNLTE